MKQEDLRYIGTIIGNLSGIPVRIYVGEQQIFYHALTVLPQDPMALYREQLWNVNGQVGYIVTRHFNYYGIVRQGDMRFIIGPTRQVENSDQELRELAFRADVAPGDIEAFIDGMKGIVRMPLETVLQILCAVNYLLCGEKLGLKDITIYEAEQDALDFLSQQQRNRQTWSKEDVQTSNAHNTYALEQKMLRMVRKGDTAGLKQWFASAPAVNGGILASDQIRQVKNTFVVSDTLTARAAIEGGMDAAEAFALSDAYIQRCELLTSLHQITNLQYHMVLEFAERTERLRGGMQPTPLTLAVSRYVQHHLSEPIRAEQIAKELFLSRPYLSARFKQETGESLTDFILKEKTEEAKRLLRYSDKSAAAICAYLGFSSQSHFSRVFKKYTGLTPREYRDKYAK